MYSHQSLIGLMAAAFLDLACTASAIADETAGPNANDCFQKELSSSRGDRDANVDIANKALKCFQARIDALETENALLRATTLSPPPGIILPYFARDGASVPEGWAICDGTNGTPDLRERFLMGVSSFGEVSAAPGQGQNIVDDWQTEPHVLTKDEMPSHSHAVFRTDSKAGTGHFVWSGAMGAIVQGPAGQTDNIGGGKGHVHKLPKFDNRPAFVSVVFIMKLKPAN